MHKPYIIGISGGSGSGKTTLLKALHQNFSAEQLCIISQDEYYKPRDEQEIDERGIKNFDLPTSIDKKTFRSDIEKLIRGEVVEKQEYTFNNPLVKPKILVFAPAPVIIVEGIFVFHFKKIFQQLDLKIFLHAKENLKVIRRIRRDQVERNYPLDDVLYRYEHHVLPTFEKYIRPYMEDADIIINNNDDFHAAIEVLSGFIHNKLREVESV